MEEIFNYNYNIYSKKVLYYILKKCRLLEAEDILQEVFLDYYQILQKKGVAYIENHEALLMKITKSKIYHHYSLLNKVKHLFFRAKNDDNDDFDEFPFIADINITKQYQEKEIINKISDYLKTKDDLTQKIFFLYFNQEITLENIAVILNINIATVRNKLYRTISQLRQFYYD